jgi:hypothetical protein
MLPAVLLGPPIRVARPADWSGSLARGASWVLAALGLVTVLLVRLPRGWVVWAWNSPELVRLGLMIAVLWVIGWIRPFVYARLPRAATLLGRTLRLGERGRRRKVTVAELRHVDVELRPPPVFEVLVVELADGTTHEVCPLDWDGAGSLYAALARRLERRVG